MQTETKIVGPNSGFNGLCLGCSRMEDGSPKYQELADRLSSALRWSKFALAACFFFGILLVMMFSCSVYLFMEIQTVRQEISMLAPPGTDADDSLSVSTAVYLETDEVYNVLDSQVSFVHLRVWCVILHLHRRCSIFTCKEKMSQKQWHLEPRYEKGAFWYPVTS